MEIIKWSDDLKSSVNAFNEEHKVLIDTINQVYTLLKEGKREEAKKTLIEKVVSYTNKHFAHEEEVMERYNYPKEKLEGHKKMHRFFVKYLLETLAPEIEKGDDKKFNEALNFIVGWLIMHIKNMDVNGYGKWFKENNIEVPDEKIEI